MSENIYFGWDIGGANTKITVFNSNYEISDFYFKNINIWSSLSIFERFVEKISKKYSGSDNYHFITLTAEACDNFETRSKGVISIINLCDMYLSGEKKYYSNNNKYVNIKEAAKNPISMYSTNWILTLNYLNRQNKINLIIDIGSTTTDFIYRNMSVSENINDFKRLSNRTLLYQGAIRTPVPMFANTTKFDEREIPIINEVYATSGDIFCILNDIKFEKNNHIGSDNLPYTEINSLNRISRLIGKDYKNEDKEKIQSCAKNLKSKFNKYIVQYISNIEKLLNEELVVTSVGEGRSLIQEICHNNKIKFIPIEKIDKLIVNNKKKQFDIYSHFTSALVVLNYFGKINE